MPRIITLYTKPGCQPCLRIKGWWKARDIDYREIDVTQSPDDLAALKSLGYEGVPVVIVSTGDPETDIHWHGLHVDNLIKYTLPKAA